jgi:hypothetical protein
VGQISTDSIARYRQVLSSQEIKYMQDFCKSGMREFGYKLDDIDLSARDRLSYLFVDWPFNFARMAFWTLKETFWGMKGRTLPARRLVPNKEVVQAS